MFERLRQRVQQRQGQFREGPITPLACYELEKELQAALAEVGRELLQEEFNRVESADKQQAAAKVRYQKEMYRINKRTPATIATSFGSVTLW